MTTNATLSYSETSAFSYTIGDQGAIVPSWPITLAANTTLTFASDLTITTTLQYFIIGGTGVTIDGNGYKVNVTGVLGYPGLVQNGQYTYTGYDGAVNVSPSTTNNMALYFAQGTSYGSTTLQNIEINVAASCLCGILPTNSVGVTTPSLGSSWLCHALFGYSTTSTNSINNCSTNGQNGNYIGTVFTFYTVNTDNFSSGNPYASVSTNGNYGSAGSASLIGPYTNAQVSGCFANISSDTSGLIGQYFNPASAISNTISNCYVICGGAINNGIVGIYNKGSISNCYVICGGDISGSSGGIAGRYNQGSISNCYVISKGNISRGGIVDRNNQGSISNCYVICGGDISGGIAGGSTIAVANSGTISNCYVICGGNILGGGIAELTTKTISNCYVICGGTISGGGIAKTLSGTSASISNCHVDTTYTGNNMFVLNGGTNYTTNGSSNNSYGTTAKWSSTGASKLLANVWTNIDTTNNLTPFILSAFNTAVTTDTNTDDSSLALTSYGQSLSNGTVTSLPGATWTYSTASITTNDTLTADTYNLKIYAYNLLSNISGFAFSNDDKIETAYNVTPTDAIPGTPPTPASRANTIVPYMYSYNSYDITVNTTTAPPTTEPPTTEPPTTEPPTTEPPTTEPPTTQPPTTEPPTTEPPTTEPPTTAPPTTAPPTTEPPTTEPPTTEPPTTEPPTTEPPTTEPLSLIHF